MPLPQMTGIEIQFLPTTLYQTTSGMKKQFKLMSLSTLACICTLGSLYVSQEAQGAFSIAVGGTFGRGAAVSFQYDPAGFPIWGYTPSGFPIYAYSPAGVPIIVMNGIYSGCYVPTWGPAPCYRGRYFWPAGVYRRPYCPPPVHRHGPPPPPVHRPCPPPPPPSYRPFPPRPHGPAIRPGFSPGYNRGHYHGR
jgi:hypothetical protein